jgi:hypothetical protein
MRSNSSRVVELRGVAFSDFRFCHGVIRNPAVRLSKAEERAQGLKFLLCGEILIGPGHAKLTQRRKVQLGLNMELEIPSFALPLGGLRPPAPKDAPAFLQNESISSGDCSMKSTTPLLFVWVMVFCTLDLQPESKTSNQEDAPPSLQSRRNDMGVGIAAHAVYALVRDHQRRCALSMD